MIISFNGIEVGSRVGLFTRDGEEICIVEVTTDNITFMVERDAYDVVVRHPYYKPILISVTDTYIADVIQNKDRI